MTDATYIGPLPLQQRRSEPTASLPAPQPVAAPVLLYDCVTPLGSETLLSLLMKRMAQDDQL